jgi:hypothetical protein
MASIINSDNETAIDSIFNYYSLTKSYLDCDDFNRLCSNLGIHMYNAHFAYVNVSCDGNISYDEFKNWWIRKDKLKCFDDEHTDNFIEAYKLYKNEKYDDHKESFYDFCKWLKWF